MTWKQFLDSAQVGEHYIVDNKKTEFYFVKSVDKYYWFNIDHNYEGINDHTDISHNLDSNIKVIWSEKLQQFNDQISFVLDENEEKKK